MSRKPYDRTQRLGSLLREVISEIIQKEIKHDDIGLFTITRVDVTPDLRFADVYVSFLDETSREENLEKLTRASGAIRSALGRMVRMKYTPKIRFHIDLSLERADRIWRMLQKMKNEDSGDI